MRIYSSYNVIFGVFDIVLVIVILVLGSFWN